VVRLLTGSVKGDRVTSQLSGIPVEKRRQLAATIGLFAVLFFAVGAVAWTGPSTVGMRVFVGLAFTVAAVLALVAWGVLTSVKRDLADERLDAAIAETIAAKGGLTCGCGHDHDPTELHITDACAHDGSGEACAHDCETCVLAALRPAPVGAAAAGVAAGPARAAGPAPATAARPSPRPRPRPTPTPR
jgi:hypothetical protein